MRIELFKRLGHNSFVKLPKLLLSIHKATTTEERNGPWMIFGQLYRGYAGLMLSLKWWTVDLWIAKWDYQFPRLKTWSIGI